MIAIVCIENRNDLQVNKCIVNKSFNPNLKRHDKIIVFKLNSVYPPDSKFDIDISP